MEQHRKRFTVRLAVVIRPENVARETVLELQKELELRPHLLNPRVSWEAETDKIIVEIVDEGIDAQQVSNGLAEEVWEATAAIMGDFNTMHVEILP